MEHGFATGSSNSSIAFEQRTVAPLEVLGSSLLAVALMVLIVWN